MTLVKEYQSLSGLEGGAGWVGGHNGAVIERLQPVVDQVAVVLATLLTHKQCRVIARAGHQREDLPGRRLDGDERARAALHQLLPVLLEMRVDSGMDILSGHGEFILGTVVVRSIPLYLRRCRGTT